MNEPLVSIVLPTFNRARLLDCAVASILAQTYPRWELIIVDDCSTDDTPQTISGLAARDDRIRSVRNDVNRKLPASLNAGFRAARGHYFTWISDDNAFRPTAIEEMVGVLEAEPEVALAYANFTVVDEAGNVLRRVAGDRYTAWDRDGREAIWPIDRSPGRIFIDNVVGFCFLYRRSVRERVGEYAEDLFLAEDFEYWMRIARDSTLRHIDRDLYVALEHAGSLSSQRWAQVRHAAVAAMARNLPHMKWVGHSQLAEAYSSMASDMACIGHLGAARRYLLQAARHSLPATLRHAPPGLLLKAVLPQPVYLRGRNLWKRFRR